MKPSQSETIENILEELFAVLDTSNDRLRELGIVMPAIYHKAAAQIVGPADMEARHAAERLLEELQRQGIVTRNRVFSTAADRRKGRA